MCGVGGEKGGGSSAEPEVRTPRQTETGKVELCGGGVMYQMPSAKNRRSGALFRYEEMSEGVTKVTGGNGFALGVYNCFRTANWGGARSVLATKFDLVGGWELATPKLMQVSLP